MQRDMGPMFLRYRGNVGGSTVVFGEARDESLLGVTALEALGFQVDPSTGRLVERKVLLMVTSVPV